MQPRWIRPRWDAELHLAHPPSPEQFEDAWQRYPDAAGALVVSPTPYGTCADIEGIAEVCHDRGKPLIVDEAWGAHLPFHEDLPTWAMDAGADVCVVSVHKMGAGFEQGSVFHLQGDLVDPAPAVGVRRPADDDQPERAGLRGDRRLAPADGRSTATTCSAPRWIWPREVRARIDGMPGLHVLEDELLAAEASTTWTGCRC